MRAFVLLHVVLLLGAVFAESAVEFCDRRVATQLEERGLHLGYNEESGEFVVVAHSQTRCADPSVDLSAWAFCRDVFLKAHVKARREIANMVKGTLVASNAVAKMTVDSERLRTQTATIAMNADELPLGVVMLAAEGTWRDGIYAASVAMAWSAKWDGRSRNSMAGLIEPAEDWKLQLHKSVEAARIELLPPFGEFVDSNGYVHFYGADVSDVLSRPVKGRGAVLLSMETRALARLQSVRDGAGKATLETQIFAERKSTDGVIKRTAAGGIGTSATGAAPINKCVFEGNVMSETFERSLYAIVYAVDYDVKPSTQRKMINPSNSADRGVMIFNPNTGKYEEK